MAKNQQVPNATVQGEVLLAKYLTESIRSIEHCIRKAASHGAPLATLPRSLSAPRVDPRAEARRPSTEVLLPRHFPAAAYVPVAAAAAAAAVAAAATAATAKVAATRPTATGGQVAVMQSRLLQPGTSPYVSTTVQHRPTVVTNGTSMQPVLPKAQVGARGASPLPPRPAVVRTVHAAQHQQHHPFHQQQQQKQHQQKHQYAGAAAATNSAGGGGAIKSHHGRSASAPRIDDANGQGRRTHPSSSSPSPTSPHAPPLARGGLARMSSSSGVPQPAPQPPPRHARSEARVPAVAAAPPLAGLLAGGARAGPQGDARSSASVRRSAPSDAGTHSSWWRWRPVTDASYPLTAVTDRYAQSMSPSEMVRWNDRVARLEAEITAEKERRRQFEEQLKKFKVVTKSEPQAQGTSGSGRQTSKGALHPFR